jgi:hypothetical protein
MRAAVIAAALVAALLVDVVSLSASTGPIPLTCDRACLERRVEMIGPSATYHINSPWGGVGWCNPSGYDRGSSQPPAMRG